MKTQSRFFAFTLSYFLTFILLIGCVETPSEPTADNPLDANNPGSGGDPYDLTAQIADGGVHLTWQAVNLNGLAGYNIYRKEDNNAFSRLHQVSSTTLTYTDRTIQNGHRYEYYVVTHSNSAEGDASNVASVAINADPVIYIEGENITHTPTRNVTLTILAYGARQMLPSNQADFSGASWETFASNKVWQLTTGTGTKTVYMQVVYADGDTSEVISDGIEPQALTSSIVIEHDSTHTAARQVELAINAVGAIEMKLSNEPFTGSEEWIAYAENLNWVLSTGGGTKTVYLKVRNDFLIEAEASDGIEPQAISPSLRIDSDSTYINHRDVTLALATTGASDMKLSDTSDSSSVNWQDFEDQVDWNLPAGDGWKYIYGWFRNDFYTSGMVSDSIGLDTRAVISTFEWSSTGGDTLAPDDRVTFTLRTNADAFGAETGGDAVVTVEGWDGIDLVGQADGSYTGGYTITDDTPVVSNARVVVSFTDRAGNEVTDDANETITAWWTPAPGTERSFPLGNSGESIVMCWIPAGSFMMGAQDVEGDAGSDEGPRHQVILTEGFWLGKYELTQAQWEAVAGWEDFGFPGNPDRPAERVSWNDIDDDFLSEIDDSFRLPTEAEWEYACRAGVDDEWFFFGSSYANLGDYAWYYDNSSSRTHDVGGKDPNPWGLHDMHGNVYEWCEDWYDSDYYDECTPSVTDPLGPGNGSFRVIRGGCWGNDARFCRSAFRDINDPSLRYYDLGFRLARSND